MSLKDEILGIEDMVVPFKAPNARAIRRWAGQPGKLPPGKKVGNEIIWVKAEVLAWLSSESEAKTSEFKTAADDLIAGVKSPVSPKRRPGRPKKMA